MRSMKIIVSIVLSIVLISGCAQQGKLAKPKENKNTLLEQLSQYQYNDETGLLGLEYTFSEFKVNNRLKGNVAFVFKKVYDETLMLEYSEKRYQSDYKDKYEAYLIEKLQESIEILQDSKQKAKIALTPIQLEQIQSLIQSMEHIVTDIHEDRPYTMDETLNQINAIRNGNKTASIQSIIIELNHNIEKNKEDKQAVKLLESIRKDIQDMRGNQIKVVYNRLTKIKDTIIKRIKDETEKLAIYQMKEQLSQVIQQSGEEVTIAEVSRNKSEIYANIAYKKIDQIHNGCAVQRINYIYEDYQNNTYMVPYITKLKCKYLIYSNKSPEFMTVYDKGIKLNNKKDQIHHYQLSQEEVKFIEGVNLQYNQYRDDLKVLNESYEKKVDSNNIDTLAMNQDVLLEGLRRDIETLNEKYAKKANHLLALLQQSIKDIKIKKQPSFEARSQAFNQYQVWYMDFDEPLETMVKLTLEGHILVQYKDNMFKNTQMDQVNFQVGGVPVRKDAINITPNTTEAVFIFKFNKIGLDVIKIASILLLIGLIVLAFINKRVFLKALTGVFLILVGFIVVYPLTWVIGASFNTSQSLVSVGISPIPKNPSLLQFQRLFTNTKYIYWYWNTFKIAIAQTGLSLLFFVTTAYVFSRFRFKGKKSGLMGMLVIQGFPNFIAITAIYQLLSYITILRPLLGTDSLIDTHLGLVLIYVAGGIPYNTWLVKGYFDTIDKSLDEAARIDGAGHMKTFWKIILPLGRPIIAFVAVTAFYAPWMEYILAQFILTSDKNRTLAIGLFNLIDGQTNNYFTMFAAGAVLVGVPITLLFGFFQKYIVQGLSSGAVKG